MPTLVNRLSLLTILNIEIYDDWRKPIKDYLIGLIDKPSKSLRLEPVNYIMYSGLLFKRGADGMLLECLCKLEGLEVIAQLHEGLCGAHQFGIKMRWLLQRYSVYWPTILKDCIEYAKGYQECQNHGSLKHLPTVDLQYVIKP